MTQARYDTDDGVVKRERAAAHEPTPLPTRLGRLRRTPALRALVQEARLTADDLILPLFVGEDGRAQTQIPSMPGLFAIRS